MAVHLSKLDIFVSNILYLLTHTILFLKYYQCIVDKLCQQWHDLGLLKDNILDNYLITCAWSHFVWYYANTNMFNLK